MASLGDLPDGWVVWNDGADGRAVLVYRPDVFDAEGYPSECLPTIYVTRGPERGRRPGSRTAGRGADRWHVTLFLEPAVEYPEAPTFGDREAAVEGAVDLAGRFAAGELDLRGCYQRPREAYLGKLAELTG